MILHRESAAPGAMLLVALLLGLTVYAFRRWRYHARRAAMWSRLARAQERLGEIGRIVASGSHENDRRLVDLLEAEERDPWPAAWASRDN